MRKKQVLVIGGGFGGVKAALELSGHEAFAVTLLSERDDFEYYPTLYHTATGGSREVSSIPLGEIFAGKRITLLVGRADKLDRRNKTVTTAAGTKLDYDILIVGLGVVTNYFGIKGIDEYSYGIKSLNDAEELKKHLHDQLIADHKPDLNYIIIGGGPTGVELAGDLPVYMHKIMRQHGLRDRKVHVDLIEAAPRLMPRMAPSVSRAIARRLRRLGVTLYIHKPVQAEDANELLVDGKPIRSHTVVWTAGIANNPFFANNHFMLSKNGKVQVDKLLQAWPGIFVIGDNADTKYSGMAQTALYDARFVANNLIRHAEGLRPYAYVAKAPVYVTPVGPKWAVVVWGKLHIYGRLGWWLRRAADWIGYHDVEPWWKATQHTLAESKVEDGCLLCATGVAAKA